jgi:hypothetical protein
MDVGCYVNFLLLRSEVKMPKGFALVSGLPLHVILRLSSIPRFGKGLKVLSDRLQAARQILTSAGFTCRNPFLIEPSKCLVALLPEISVLLNRRPSWFRNGARGVQLWHTLQVCLLFRVEVFATTLNCSCLEFDFAFLKFGHYLSLFTLSYLITLMAYLCSKRTPNVQIKYFMFDWSSYRLFVLNRSWKRDAPNNIIRIWLLDIRHS